MARFVPLLSSKSCMLGILGPFLLPLDLLSCPGNAGPMESSLSLSSSTCFADGLELCLSTGVVFVFGRSSRRSDVWSAADSTALWNVEGSYHPSDSSPRFLHKLANILPFSGPRPGESLPSAYKRLPSTPHLNFVHIFQDLLLLDVEICRKHGFEGIIISFPQFPRVKWQFFRARIWRPFALVMVSTRRACPV